VAQIVIMLADRLSVLGSRFSVLGSRFSVLKIALPALFIIGIGSLAADDAAPPPSQHRPQALPTAPGAVAPETADEIELAELDREIGDALREIRARPLSLQARFGQIREFLRLNTEIYAERELLVAKVRAAPRPQPAAAVKADPRTPLPGESPEEARFRDTEHAFASAIRALRSSGLPPAEQHQRMLRLLEDNRDLLAEQDTRRARLVAPLASDAPSVFVPRAPMPGENPQEAELRRLEDALASDLFLLRGQRREGADALAGHRRVMEKNATLLARQTELRHELTEAALDKEPVAHPLPPQPTTESQPSAILATPNPTPAKP